MSEYRKVKLDIWESCHITAIPLMISKLDKKITKMI